MERKKYVIFTAGGSGTRMGAAEPKQFLPLDGVCVLQRSTTFAAQTPQMFLSEELLARIRR